MKTLIIIGNATLANKVAVYMTKLKENVNVVNLEFDKDRIDELTNDHTLVVKGAGVDVDCSKFLLKESESDPGGKLIEMTSAEGALCKLWEDLFPEVETPYLVSLLDGYGISKFNQEKKKGFDLYFNKCYGTFSDSEFLEMSNLLDPRGQARGLRRLRGFNPASIINEMANKGAILVLEDVKTGSVMTSNKQQAEEAKARKEAEEKRIEDDRIAAEEAAKLEKERLQKIEDERLAKEKADKEEAERLAAEEAEKARLQKEEDDRKAREAAEEERLAAEEAERLAAEEAEKARLQKEEDDRIAAEEQRLADEEAAKLAAEEAEKANSAETSSNENTTEKEGDETSVTEGDTSSTEA